MLCGAPMCDNLLTAIADFNASNVDPDLLPLLLSYTPAGGRRAGGWEHAAPASCAVTLRWPALLALHVARCCAAGQQHPVA